jgi:hypothetical protein
MLLSGVAGAQVPASLIGKWRVQRILPTERAGCWNAERAKILVGSTLVYQARAMTWRGGEVPLNGIRAVVRSLTRREFAVEYGVELETIGVKAATVQEVDLQHEDADVTGATTEVPGDTVVLTRPGRIVVSTCGVFYEAVRAGH